MEKCKTCTHYGRDCIPFVLSLSGSDLIQWMKVRKDALRLSNQDIADCTDVPKGTVDRIFSSKVADFRLSTIQPIVRALAGCAQDDLTCAPQSDESLSGQVAHLEDTIQRLEAENKRQTEYIRQLTETARVDIERAKKEEEESLSYMKSLARRRLITVYVLAILLGAALAVIIAALVIDRIDPRKGFIWLNLSQWFSTRNMFMS